MTHGIYHSNYIKHGEILDFSKYFQYSIKDREVFKENYDFMWDVFNDVAKQNGIKLPKFWVVAEPYTRSSKTKRQKSNVFVLEPLGPVIHVDYNSNPITQFYNNHRGMAIYSVNWYQLAEKFFMVRHSAKHVLGRGYTPRPALLCEKWRTINVKELNREREKREENKG